MASYEVHTFTAKASYDVCESCGGLWLDKGQLDKLAFQVDGDIEYCSTEQTGEPDSAKLCPRCPGEHLHKVKFLGGDALILERCDNCTGFWLDGGQIERIDNQLARIMHVKGKGFSEFLANTHLPHYKYIKRDSAETDFRVPVVPVANARPLGTSKHKCPNDGLCLEGWEAGGAKIETCPKCGGLWLHEKELKTLKDKADDGNLRWMNDEIAAIEKTSAMVSDKNCPECGNQKLLSTYFGNSGITIDRCDQCHGIWLECDEFNGMLRYLADEADHATSADMKAKVTEEVGKIADDHSESTFSELRDAESALGALINTSIFEHPKLAGFLLRANKAERVLGGG